MPYLKKIMFFSVLPVIFILLFTGVSFSEPGPPPYLNYQGQLNNDQGNPVTGEKTMVFRLYATISADLADALWQSGDVTVQVQNGKFSVNLGESPQVAISQDLFSDSERYLGVTVDGTELMPRKRLMSVPYAMNCGIPQGAIIMWSGSVGDIPAGWALCDGTDGTPNLRDRFIVGAGGGYSVGGTGGTNSNNLSHSHIVNNHTHGISSDGNHNHHIDHTMDLYSHIGDVSDKVEDGTNETVGSEDHGHRLHFVVDTWNSGNHSHGGATGGSSPGTNSKLSSSVENRPLYYALCFIMKQ